MINTQKKTRTDAKPSRIRKKQSQTSWTKAMTIRYDEIQEGRIMEMAKKMGEKTMSKAFLKAPELIDTLHYKVQEAEDKLKEQAEKMQRMQEIVDTWGQFSEKLKNFVNR